MKLYCGEKDCYTDWREVELIDLHGNKYAAYECKCTDEQGNSRVCREDKALIDIDGGKSMEMGHKIGAAMADMVIACVGG